MIASSVSFSAEPGGRNRAETAAAAATAAARRGGAAGDGEDGSGAARGAFQLVTSLHDNKHARFLRTLGRWSLIFGAQFVVIAGFFILIYAVPVSVIGFGYLLLLILIFAYPPMNSYYRYIRNRALQHNETLPNMGDHIRSAE